MSVKTENGGIHLRMDIAEQMNFAYCGNGIGKAVDDAGRLPANIEFGSRRQTEDIVVDGIPIDELHGAADGNRQDAGLEGNPQLVYGDGLGQGLGFGAERTGVDADYHISEGRPLNVVTARLIDALSAAAAHAVVAFENAFGRSAKDGHN